MPFLDFDSRFVAVNFLAHEMQDDVKYAQLWRDSLVQMMEDEQVPKEKALRIAFKFMERAFTPRAITKPPVVAKVGTKEKDTELPYFEL